MRGCLSVSYPTCIDVGIFPFSLCVGVTQLVSGFLLQGIDPHVALHLGGSTEVGKFGNLLCYHLSPSPMSVILE